MHPKVIQRTRVARIAAFVALAGCGAQDAQEGSKGNHAPAGADHRRLVSPLRASVEVPKMLYERNLISVPEVNRKMNEAVLEISREGASPDSVMPRFFRWLEDWAAAHPDQVEAARLAGGAYTLEARRLYVDTDSSRRAQVDSVRALARSTAKRQIEFAGPPSATGH
jgi:hypothetical protein